MNLYATQPLNLFLDHGGEMTNFCRKEKRPSSTSYHSFGKTIASTSRANIIHNLKPNLQSEGKVDYYNTTIFIGISQSNLYTFPIWDLAKQYIDNDQFCGCVAIPERKRRYECLLRPKSVQERKTTKLGFLCMEVNEFRNWSTNRIAKSLCEACLI